MIKLKQWVKNNGVRYAPNDRIRLTDEQEERLVNQGCAEFIRDTDIKDIVSNIADNDVTTKKEVDHIHINESQENLTEESNDDIIQEESSDDIIQEESMDGMTSEESVDDMRPIKGAPEDFLKFDEEDYSSTVVHPKKKK